MDDFPGSYQESDKMGCGRIFLGVTVGLGILIAAFNHYYEPPKISNKHSYMGGTIKTERSVDNFFNPDRYIFTLSTKNGFKMFQSYGQNAQRMDGLLDPKDRIKIRIPKEQIDRQNNFSVGLEDIVEINGKPFQAE